MRYFFYIYIFVLLMVLTIFGFRGKQSEREPLYMFPDMDWQIKYKPQAENDFFNDNRNDRPVVPGTVERGYMWDTGDVFEDDYTYNVAENPPLYTGKNEDGSWYRGFPIPVDMALLEMGQEKYEIYCTVCHGATGDGNGITKSYGMLTVVGYHSDRLRDMAEGEIYNTIVNGKNTMYPYGDKLTPEERWAVVAYVRALQTAQNARAEDVPATQQKELGL